MEVNLQVPACLRVHAQVQTVLNARVQKLFIGQLTAKSMEATVFFSLSVWRNILRSAKSWYSLII